MLQVISSVTSNKQCVSNIADANVLQFVLLVLHMLPPCECICMYMAFWSNQGFLKVTKSCSHFSKILPTIADIKSLLYRK